LGVEVDLNESILKKILKIQKTEQTEYFVYRNLAKKFNGTATADVLNRIANDELGHHNFWKKYTQQEVKPNKWVIWFYSFLGRFLGLTFSIKLMEKAEERAQNYYTQIVEAIPEAKKIIAEEETHENTLIGLIDEEKLKYAGAIVLGLNDALVELTGALAGLTFALQNTRIIALAGLITGIAASFSMSASSYLSARAEGEGKDHLKSAVYTGIAYIITVLLLVAPYLIITNPFFAMIITIAIAILIIFCFNYYISVAKDYSFKSRFLEMVLINLVVTGITFLIGLVIREIFGINI
jgi:VIT1/CCC1 family predicted Fe2+/Mn2+ transporter